MRRSRARWRDGRGLELLDGPAGTVALAAVEATASRSPSCWRSSTCGRSTRVSSGGSSGPRIWRGTIEVDGPRAGSGLRAARRQRAPARARCASARTRVPRRREPAADARVVAGDRRGTAARLDQPRRQAVRRGARGGAAGAAGRARAAPWSTRSPRSCWRPATTSAWSMRSRGIARRMVAGGRAGGHEHGRLPAIRADPFWVPELDRFIVRARAVGGARRARRAAGDPRGARARGRAGRAVRRDRRRARGAGLGGELKPFQRAGVEYLLKQRRAFLADEQGLGKTIEALATIEADDAYPAIVVCPASLKLNWMREIERWLPGALGADARRQPRRGRPAGGHDRRQLRHRRRPARRR